MTIEISTHAKEESTFIIQMTFTDEDGDAVVPQSIKWHLMDINGLAYINSRQDVAVASPSSVVDVVLYGDDLQILSTESHKSEVKRKFIVEATYNSDLASNLPLKGETVFTIDNLSHVAV